MSPLLLLVPSSSAPEPAFTPSRSRPEWRRRLRGTALVRLGTRALLRAFPLLLVGILPFVLACESDSLKPEPPADRRDLYWDIELNHHAVTLSLAAPGHETLQLVATPQNYLGEPLTGLPAPRYHSEDIRQVVVTGDGMLVAVAPTSRPVMVTATITTNNLKHIDTVFVQVVNNPAPPVLATFSIDPPDSAKVAVGIKGEPPVLAADAGAVPITGLPVYFRSSDTTTARYFPVDMNARDLTRGIVQGIRPGTVTLYASTTAFGVTKADTLTYRIGRRLFAEINVPSDPLRVGAAYVLGSFSKGPDLLLGTGASVEWASDVSPFTAGAQAAEVDITFTGANLSNIAAPNLEAQDPWVSAPAAGFGTDIKVWCDNGAADCGSGNARIGGGTVPGNTFPPFPMFAVRRFPVPGTYEYHSTLRGTSGRIVIVDER
jgi:hypothetical protein